MKNQLPSFILGLILAHKGIPFVYHVVYLSMIVLSFIVGKHLH